MSFKELEQKHNLVNRVILACGKRPTDADINPLLEERLERFYEDAVIEGMAKQMHSSVDRAVNAMVNPQMMQIKDGKLSYLKKPWQGLTDDEIEDTWGNTPMMLNARDGGARRVFARAIEAKLKEKNNAL